MKPASTALQALLASRQFWACDLYVITLVGGGVLRYAGGDCDVLDPGGNRYSCGGMTGPYFDRADSKSTCHWKLGTETDTLTFDLVPSQAQVLGLPLTQALRQGLFDGAVLQLLRAYAPAPPSATSWPVPVTGTLIKFTGFIAEADGGGTVVTITVNSALERLGTKWPRNLYQPGCVNVVGDAACGVNLASFAVNGAAAAGSTASTIATSLPKAAGYFDLGAITFTSGPNAGLKRGVAQWNLGQLMLMTPFPAAPVVGDGFVIMPGCDGTMDAGGCPKFNNLANFRGFPFIPAPSTAGA